MDYEYDDENQAQRNKSQEATLPHQEDEHDDAAQEDAARNTTSSYNFSGPSTIPSMMNQSATELFYECAQCGEDNELKAKDAIRCRQCGYRILFKKRTNKVVQFEAR